MTFSPSIRVYLYVGYAVLGQCLCTDALWVGASAANLEHRESAQKFAWAREKQGVGWVPFMGRPSSVSWCEGVRIVRCEVRVCGRGCLYERPDRFEGLVQDLRCCVPRKG